MDPNCENNNSSSDDDVDLDDTDYANNYESDSDEYSEDDDDLDLTVLTMDEVVEHMNCVISKVYSVTDLPKAVIRILLDYYKWNSDIMMERYYITNDQDEFFQDADLSNPFKFANAANPKNCDSEILCQICVTTTSEFSSFECGHAFCGDCWNNYLKTKIVDEGMEKPLSCMAYQCLTLIEDEICISLLKDTKVRRLYQTLITKSFVECNRLTRWCPNPNCNNVIKVNYITEKPVSCSCGTALCFLCGLEWHSPVKCNLIQKWNKKCEFKASHYWIATNTKNCPKCKIAIEKVGGCKFLTCIQKTCKHQFCWLCLCPLEYHDCDKCIPYDEEEARNRVLARKFPNAELKRYVFHYTRYLNHKRSLELKSKLQLDVNRNIKELQKEGFRLPEFQCLERALQVLSECRRTLMYTYVFAHYLTQNTQYFIFEENQSDLQDATETLSAYLEKDLETTKYDDLGPKIQHQLIYCSKRRMVLEDHIYEGYEKNLWEYLD